MSDPGGMVDRRKGWTPEQDARLRALWAQDNPRLSTSEIGAEMGVGKNAVVGRAHRLHLQPRPSPISDRAAYPALLPKPRKPAVRRARLPRWRDEGAAVVQRTRAASAAALRNPIPAVSAGDPGPAGFPGNPGPVVPLGLGRVTGFSSQNLPPAPIPVPGVFSGRGCRWPLWGNTERPDHRYCDAPACRGSYCATHAARAYAVPHERDPAHQVARGGIAPGGWAA